MPGASVTAETATPIPGVGHDYIHLLAETVDPSSGAVSISITFPVAASRGITMPLSLSYHSSGVFQVSEPHSLGLITHCPTNAVDYAIPFGTGCGWQYGVPSLSYSNQVVTPLSGPPGGSCLIDNHYTFTEPQGTGHDLYGLAETWQTNANSICPSPLGGPTIPPAESWQDDEVTAELPQAGAGTGGAAPVGLTVSDSKGTVYSNFTPFGPSETDFDYFVPEQIEDRNGNIIRASHSYNNTNNQYNVSLTDTAGRSAATVSGTGLSSTTDTVTSGGISLGVEWSTTAASYAYEWALPPTQNANDMSISIVNSNGFGSYCPQNGFSVSSAQIDVVSAINLPNGQQFTLYSGNSNPTDSTILNPYGLLNEIVYPSGGWVKYTYMPNPTYSLGATLAAWEPVNGGGEQEEAGVCWYQYNTPVVATRKVSYDGVHVALEQTFNYSTTFTSDSQYWTTKSTTVTTTDELANTTQSTVYTYQPYTLPVEKFSGSQYGVQIPLENTTSKNDWGSSSALVTTTKWWKDQFSMFEVDTTVGSVTSKTKYPGGSYLPTEIDEYDFGASTAARKTLITYGTFSSPGTIRDEPCQQVVEDGSGNWIAEADSYYDGGTTLCATVSAGNSTTGVSNLPTGTHDTNFNGSSTTPRGNLTRQVRLLSSGGAGPTTTYTYDDTGQVLKMTAPCGNQSCTDISGSTFVTNYSYADSYTILSGGANTTYTPSANTNSFLTTITDPLGYTQNFTYDYNNGQLTSAKDQNGNTTGFVYNDSLNRPTETTSPDGGMAWNQYNDSPPSPSVVSCKLLNTTVGSGTCPISGVPSGSWVSNTATMDGMGHTVESQLTTDPAGTDTVKTTYDGMGNVSSVTNPFRGSSPPASTTITYLYDALKRTTRETEQDGSYQLWCYNNSAPGAGNCTVHLGNNSSQTGSVTGTWADYTDENGNHWQRSSDAFGRLTEVMEPNGSSQTPSMETDYLYSQLNNLLTVTQWGGAFGSSGSRTRSFLYDSLSRLVQSYNPESGYVCYGTTGGTAPNGSNCTSGYDANGNVGSKTDARGIVTNFAYNAINQLLQKTYQNDTGGTPISCYEYGTSTSGNTVERLINEWTQAANSTCSSAPTAGSYLSLKAFQAYDQMGRVMGATQQHCVGSTCSAPSAYSLIMAYDSLGNLKTLTNSVGANGSPLTLSNYFNGASQPCLTTSTWGQTSSPSENFPMNLFQTNSSTTTGSTGYTTFGGLQNWYLGSTSSGASSGCGSNPTSQMPGNLIQTFSPSRMWLTSYSALGQVP